MDDSQIRRINLPTAISIVVASMVGTGVFTSLGFQVPGLPSGYTIILLWTMGGLISLCGAVCYAEIGAMLPRSGGEYHILREAYHPAIGFLAGWISITVGFAGPIAAAAVAFGTYFYEIPIAQTTDQTEVSSGDESTSASVIESENESAAALAAEEVKKTKFRQAVYKRSLATGMVLLIAGIHFCSISIVGRFQLIFTYAKVGLILVLIVCAFVLGSRQETHFLPQAEDFNLIRSKAFAISLVYVMYSYTGWNGASYIAGELKNPQRNLPLALLIGTALVTLLYVGLNAAFLYCTPIEKLSGNAEVGLIAAREIFGVRGGAIMGLLISFGLVSTISSMTWTGPRVAATMGEDYRLFRLLSVRNRFGVPLWSLMIQSLIAILLVAFTLEQLMNYIMSILTLSSLFAVFAVAYLRIKRPDADRPYRVQWLPVPLTVFTLFNLYMLYFQIVAKPLEILCGVLTLVAGFIMYLLSEFTNRRTTAKSVA